MSRSVDLSVTLGKVQLKNPVMPSSGTFGYGEEFSDFLNLEDLGAVIVKSVSLHPKMGNPPNRFTEVSGSCFISTVGFQNVGLERFVQDKLPYLRQFSVPLIVSIMGDTVEEYPRVAEVLDGVEGISALEISMACPNVKEGGMAFCARPETTYQIVKSVRDATGLTIIPKVAPGQTDAVTLARVCEEAGADAIFPNFSVMGMAIDVERRRSKLGKNLMGGVQGPWVKPIGVRQVWQVAQAVKIPIIGCGGITCAEDALEYIIAGATVVEIGSYGLIDPTATIKTIKGIEEFLVKHNVGSIAELRGSLVLC